MKESKESIIKSTRKQSPIPCFLLYLLLRGPPWTLYPSKALFHYILPRIRKQLSSFSSLSSQANYSVFFFFLLSFSLLLNLDSWSVKWTTVLISSMHTPVIQKATGCHGSQKFTAKPLVTLNGGGNHSGWVLDNAE